MTNTLELKAVMLLKGVTIAGLAEKIGISKTSLSYKINNKREFKSTEISKIEKILGLSIEQKDKIFFCQKC